MQVDGLRQADESEFRSRLANMPFEPITLHFSRPEAFCGHGILLNCIGVEDAFRLLREHVLSSRHIRSKQPHITLAHPRDSQAPGNSLINASRLQDVITVTFQRCASSNRLGMRLESCLRDSACGTSVGYQVDPGAKRIHPEGIGLSC